MSNIRPLKYEELLQAHTGYSLVLQGLQQAQTGFETVLMSGFFDDNPDERKNIANTVSLIASQCRDVAKGKGLLVEVVRNIDRISADVQKRMGISGSDPTNPG